jgi:hypothetical protein
VEYGRETVRVRHLHIEGDYTQSGSTSNGTFSRGARDREWAGLTFHITAHEDGRGGDKVDSSVDDRDRANLSADGLNRVDSEKLVGCLMVVVSVKIYRGRVVEVFSVRVRIVIYRLNFHSSCRFQSGLLLALGVYHVVLTFKFVAIHVMFADARILRMTRLATTFADCWWRGTRRWLVWMEATAWFARKHGRWAGLVTRLLLLGARRFLNCSATARVASAVTAELACGWERPLCLNLSLWRGAFDTTGIGVRQS